jgi:hypothetical protein
MGSGFPRGSGVVDMWNFVLRIQLSSMMLTTFDVLSPPSKLSDIK